MANSVLLVLLCCYTFEPFASKLYLGVWKDLFCSVILYLAVGLLHNRDLGQLLKFETYVS